MLGYLIASAYSPLSRYFLPYAYCLMKVTTQTKQAAEAAAISTGAPAPLSTQGRGSNWVHESLGVIETPACGYGVIALEAISEGALVVMFGGRVLTAAEFERLPEEMQAYPYQVGDDLFLGPRDAHDIGIGERINHSCSPNVGFSGSIALVALRDIAQGEEITLDYATCVASDDEAFLMRCLCGASNCRGVITGQDWRRPELQARLLPHYQPFLQAKVRASSPSDKVRLIRLSSASNDDQPQSGLNPRSNSGDARALARKVSGFFATAAKDEWMAVPICVLAGLPSTLATVGIMAVVAPALSVFEFARDEAGLIASISLLASVVGYITYLVAYYAGMLWKERRDWILEGRASPKELRRKLRICWYDFLAHLPYDLWVMPLIGAAIGGLFVAGLSQTWSILVANTVADIVYAIKEPFFWHGAKRLVAWREGRAAGVTTEPGRIASL